MAFIFWYALNQLKEKYERQFWYELDLVSFFYLHDFSDFVDLGVSQLRNLNYYFNVELN